MRTLSNILLVLGSGLLLPGVVSAQAVDMSRYESIYETPKKAPTVKASPPVNHGVHPGKHVETISASPAALSGATGNMGISSTPALVVRPSIPMGSGDKTEVFGKKMVPPMVPVPRTTEIITEDAQGVVIDRSVVNR